MTHSPENTCWTLVAGAARREVEAVNEFGQRYAPVVAAYLAARWRLSKDDDQVSEGLQDVFVECFRKGGVLDRVDAGAPGGFRAFLYGVVRNVARRKEQSRVRDKANRPLDTHLGEALPAEEESLAKVFDRAWARTMMREARRHLEEQAKELGQEAERRLTLLRLRFFEGRKISQIAEEWRVEAKPLYRDLERARDEFRAALREVIEFHHPGDPTRADLECRRLLEILE